MAQSNVVSERVLFQLDGGKTKQLLSALYDLHLFDEKYPDPRYPRNWTRNPINEILANDARYQEATRVAKDMGLEPRSNGEHLSATFWARAQVICQQVLWHHGNYGSERGPEGDNVAKTLRKLWYAGHKAAFQQISNRTGAWRLSEGVINDKSANQALSVICGEYVDTGKVTYLDLFCEDGSRSFYYNSYYHLPDPYANILICVEKDAAYADMVSVGKALGAKCVVSGGGKMGKAATEKILRTCFSYYFETNTPGDVVTSGNELYIIVISDWDYDGEQVIAPTFVQQIYRYIPNHLVKWTRVGVRPEHLERFGRDVVADPSVSYEAKNSTNGGYSNWCAEKACYIFDGQLFNGLSEIMSHDEYAFGLALENAGIDQDLVFPQYDNDEAYDLRDEIDEWYWNDAQGLHPRLRKLDHKQLVALYEHFIPLGFELDALRRVEYAEIMAEGFAELVDLDDLLDYLSEEEAPNVDSVADELTNHIVRNNASYDEIGRHINDLQAEFDKALEELRGTRQKFRNRVAKAMNQCVQFRAEDERVFEDDPDPTVMDLAERLKERFEESDHADHWQPYSSYDRDRLLYQITESDKASLVKRLEGLTIRYEQVSLGNGS